MTALTIRVDNGTMKVTGHAVLGKSIRAMPDISLDAIAFDSLVDTGVGGVTLTIANRGASLFLQKTVQVEILIDGMPIARQDVDISDIQPGAKKEWRYDLSKTTFSRYGRYLPPGEHKVAGRVDVKDILKERNEKNNRFETSVTVAKGCEKTVVLKSRGSAQASVGSKVYQLFSLAIKKDSVRIQVTDRQGAVTRYTDAAPAGSFIDLPGMPRMFIYTIVPLSQASVGIGCT